MTRQGGHLYLSHMHIPQFCNYIIQNTISTGDLYVTCTLHALHLSYSRMQAPNETQCIKRHVEGITVAGETCVGTCTLQYYALYLLIDGRRPSFWDNFNSHVTTHFREVISARRERQIAPLHTVTTMMGRPSTNLRSCRSRHTNTARSSLSAQTTLSSSRDLACCQTIKKQIIRLSNVLNKPTERTARWDFFRTRPLKSF